MARHPTTVIFHTGRSGSTVFGDMLNQHPSIRADTEIYAITFRKLRATQPDLLASEFTVDRHHKMTMRLNSSTSYLFEVKFFSALDMVFFSGGLSAYLRFMIDHSMSRAIVLERANTLRRIVSTLIAVKRGAFQLRIGQDSIVPRVALNCMAVRLGEDFPLVELLDRVEAEYQQLYGLLEAAAVPTLRLSYERQIQSDPQVAYELACDFLDQAPHPVVPRYARINIQPLRRVLSNFEEVRSALVGTKHEWMIEE